MQTSRFLLVATLAVIAAGCATPDPALPEPDMTPLGEVIENVHSQSELGRSSGYYATLARHWMSRQLPAKGGCFRIGEPSMLYLRIEADGTVSGVYGDPENNRSRCYRQSYIGLKVPQPPAAPFYMSLDIG